MASRVTDEACVGKGRCVGSRRVTVGHTRLTIGHLRVTMGHLRVTIGHLKVTVVHLRVTLGHLRVTKGHYFSFYKQTMFAKHKANTTELHPNVRQTCLLLLMT